MVERASRGVGLSVRPDLVWIFLALTIGGAYFSNAVLQFASGLCVLSWAIGAWRAKIHARRGAVRAATESTDASAAGPRWPFWRPALAFLVASLVAAAFSADRGRSFGKLHEVFLPLLTWAALPSLRTVARREALTRVLFLFAAAAAVWGLVEFAREHRDHRIQGTLGNWMTYSQVLALAAPVVLARLLWWRDRRGRPLELALFVVLGAAILCTKTRGVWLGGLASGVLVLLSWRPRWILAVPVGLGLLYLAAPGSVRERVHSIFDARNQTWVERVYMWRAGATMFEEHPLVGVGPGRVKALYPSYRLPDDPRTSEKVLGHLHSNPVQIAVERGAFGLATWVWFWAAVFAFGWAAFRAAHSDRARAATVGLAASLVGLQVGGLTEYNHGDSEVATLAFCLLALLVAEAAANATESVEG